MTRISGDRGAPALPPFTSSERLWEQNVEAARLNNPNSGVPQPPNSRGPAPPVGYNGGPVSYRPGVSRRGGVVRFLVGHFSRSQAQGASGRREPLPATAVACAAAQVPAAAFAERG